MNNKNLNQHEASRGWDVLSLEVSDDSLYTAFFDSVSVTNIAKFDSLSIAFHNMRLTEVEDILNSIEPENQIEEFEKYTQEIHLSILNNESSYLDSTQHENLEAIAFSDPHYFGSGVYLARILLGIAPDDASKSSERKAKKQERIKETEFEKIALFPNPTNGNITIVSETQFEVGSSLVLHNALGNQVYEMRIPEQVKQYSFDVSFLSQGIYFYELRQKTLATRHGKLVIVKD